MLGHTAGTCQALVTQNSTKDPQKNKSTYVRRFNSIFDVVAAEISVAACIPSKAAGLVYVVKNLYDIKIAKPQTPAPNQAPENSFQNSNNAQQTPSPNPTAIPDAKVQWVRDIHDDDVRTTMKSYDQFFAKYVTHHPKDIPEGAYNQLEKEVKRGNVSIDLITPERLITLKLKKQFGCGGSKSFHDIGNNQALAIIAGAHQHYDELMMLRYLEKLGIPTNEIKPAVICWEFQGVKYARATYTAPSFSAYAEQNAFVLDIKKTHEVANRLNGKKVLAEGKDPFRVENWDEVLSPLVKDVRTLVDNGVSISYDALNAILVGKGAQFHSGGHAKFEVRAFPFDFSEKNKEFAQLPVKTPLSVEEERELLTEYSKRAVKVQYNAAAISLPENWKDLINRLAERYIRKR